MREPLFHFKVRNKLSQKEIGNMFHLNQGTVSEALRTTRDGTRRYSVEKLLKPKNGDKTLYALHVEKTVAVGELPF
jgi:predicted XRE-type DNA-binding protein